MAVDLEAGRRLETPAPTLTPEVGLVAVVALRLLCRCLLTNAPTSWPSIALTTAATPGASPPPALRALRDARTPSARKIRSRRRAGLTASAGLRAGPTRSTRCYALAAAVLAGCPA
jgi:hypothetical protein